ncbi:MAG: helix-hairpin-helix domain-containing protein [Candidatus Cloacimonadaceae bacterium]
MKNPFSDLLTRDEQKILGFLSALLILGFGFHTAGVSFAHAEKAPEEYTSLQQATKQDSIIQIDIRTANPDELVLLPGIGEKRAQDIISYRQSKQFSSTEELLNISGIGAKTYLKMKPMLLPFGTSGAGVTERAKLADLQAVSTQSKDTASDFGKQELDGTVKLTNKELKSEKSVSGDMQSIVNLNTATRQELISLTGIGEVKSDAILQYRSQIGSFTSVEQLLEVKGIGPKTLEKNRHRLKI